MGEAWDAPFFPKRGNKTQTALFTSVGRALLAWEDLEVRLAHLYGLFLTGRPYDQNASVAYGVPNNFSGRMDGLEAVANSYWIKFPSQETEGDFCLLAKRIRGFSARRNDIAHSVAAYMEWARNPDSPNTLLSTTADLAWCLVPPHFRKKKFGAGKVPVIVLTSREINYFAREFWELGTSVTLFSRRIEGQGSACGDKSPRYKNEQYTLIPPPPLNRP